MTTTINYVDYKHSYAHALEPKLKKLSYLTFVQKKPIRYMQKVVAGILTSSGDVVWTEKEHEFFDAVCQHYDSTQLYWHCKNAVSKAKETLVVVDENGELIR